MPIFRSGKIITSQQEWTYELSIQQQSVLMLGCRGPDGIDKSHPIKPIIRVLRGVIMNAALFGRPLKIVENPKQLDGIGYDTFMTLEPLAFSLYQIYHMNGPDRDRNITSITLFDKLFTLGNLWIGLVKDMMQAIDVMHYHYINHLRHSCEIVGYKHPDHRVRVHFRFAYYRLVDNCHLFPETEEQMDLRLADWNQERWDISDESRN
jgi:hypothetical protein